MCFMLVLWAPLCDYMAHAAANSLCCNCCLTIFLYVVCALKIVFLPKKTLFSLNTVFTIHKMLHLCFRCDMTIPGEALGHASYNFQRYAAPLGHSATVLKLRLHGNHLPVTQ